MTQKKIAVFDFNADECAATANAVREYCVVAGMKALVLEFNAMQPFVSDFDENAGSHTPYAMVFIGVDSMMGVETARLIRDSSAYCPMFIVSNVGDYGIEGFRLHALDYLVKPVTPLRVREAIGRIGMKCLAGMQSG